MPLVPTGGLPQTPWAIAPQMKILGGATAQSRNIADVCNGFCVYSAGYRQVAAAQELAMNVLEPSNPGIRFVIN